MRKASTLVSDDRLQRELWALALLALAVLLLLSFLPPGLFGSAGARLFPTGNVVGVVGGAVASAAWALLGLPAFLLPLLPALAAAGVLGRLDVAVVTRWTSLLIGVFLLIPTGVYAFAHPAGIVPPAAGWVGAALGAPLVAGFGWLGAGLLVTFLFAAVCVVTLGRNPLRLVAGGGALAATGVLRAARAVPEMVRGRIRLPRRRGTPAEVEGWGSDLLDPHDDEEEGHDDLQFEDEEQDDPVFGAPAAPARGAPAAPSAPVPDPDATLPEPAAPPRPRARRAAEPEDVVVTVDTGDPTAADLPGTTLLAPAPPRDEQANRRHLQELGQVLVDKLATFKIQGELVGMTTGPVVTQFEISPAPGIKVARIANLDADLALAMRAASVRIVAPIPGKAAVGVEVPNPQPEMVYFREVIESPSFRNSKALLPIALGKDLEGKPYVADLAKMPHLLIAGATGSGKSVCVNTIITSLVYRHSPRSLRLLMVDPKMVELSMYNDLPHLRHPVVTDNNDAAGVLKWAVLEMERRYALLSANHVRNLQDFNRRLESGQVIRSPDPQGEEGDPDRWIYQGGPLPYIVVIIDELADLMMTVQGDVEKPLALLAQKARAIGIHLILATQRPSVNVITGLIKANFPSRIAFRVSSKVDSRTILDQNGADNLLGNGDMLFLPPAASDPLRIQGAYLSTEDSERMMDWYRDQARVRRDEALAEGRDPDADARESDILDMVRASEGDSDDVEAGDGALEDRDKLFREAAELCVQHQGGSTSLLQRRLRIGYGRAARIIDQLHHAGVLGPPDGSKPRDVLLDMIQLDQMYPED